MDIILLVSKVAQTLSREGFWAVFQKTLKTFRNDRFLEPDSFDLKYGTDTGGIEPLWKFKINSPNAHFGVHYEPTQEAELAETLAFLQQKLETFTFIDLGCGKGRTLMIAARLGFKQIIGVEFVREFAEIARTNLTKNRICNAFVVHADAADFHFTDGNTVVYLYNPFSEDVLRKVVLNLKKCCWNRLYVIYKRAECANLFDSSGFLKRFESPPKAPHMQIWTLMS